MRQRCGAYSCDRRVNVTGQSIPTRGTSQQLALVRNGRFPSRRSSASVVLVSPVQPWEARDPRAWLSPIALETDGGRVSWRVGGEQDAGAYVARWWSAFFGAGDPVDVDDAPVVGEIGAGVGGCESLPDVVVVPRPGDRRGHGIDFTRWKRVDPSQLYARPRCESWPTLASFAAEAAQ